MSPVCTDLELDTPVVEVPVRLNEAQRGPEADTPEAKQSIRELMFKIFAGHEEFLGWTPD
jgi:hypothetical protein